MVHCLKGDNSMEQINSVSYWEKRFSEGDWDKYDGESQSTFFAQLTIENIPAWLRSELAQSEYDILDYGCAEGTGTSYLAKRLPASHFIGVDISQTAIDKAKANYPYCSFEVIKPNDVLEEYDVVYSSNTLEHVEKPMEDMKRLLGCSRKYAILLLPFEDESNHSEHFHIFDADFFPSRIDNYALVFFRIIDCSDLKTPYWNGKQILVIYKNDTSGSRSISVQELYEYNIKDLISKKHQLMHAIEELQNTIVYEQQEKERISTEDKEQIEKNRALIAVKEQDHDAEIQKMQGTIDELREKSEQLHEKIEILLREKEHVVTEDILKEQKHAVAIQEMQGNIDELNSTMEQLHNQIEFLRVEKEKISTDDKDRIERIKTLMATKDQNHAEEIQQLLDKIDGLNATMGKMHDTIEGLQQEKERCFADKGQIDKLKSLIALREQEHAEVIQKMQDHIGELSGLLGEFRVYIGSVETRINNVTETGRALAGIKSFKLVHLISRVRNQWLEGTPNDRRAFYQWIWNHLFRKNNVFNDEYNPVYQMINPLEQINHEMKSWVQAKPIPVLGNTDFGFEEKEVQQVSYHGSFLEEKYDKYDVIVFGVIDYDYRYQRPQQIADYYARVGHRVFYVNANMSSGSEIEIRTLHEVNIISLPIKSIQAIYDLCEREDINEVNKHLEKIIFEFGIRDALMIVDYPSWVENVLYVRAKYGYTLVTDYMDDYTGFITTTSPHLIDMCSKLLKNSDGVIASSQYLYDIAIKHNKAVNLIRNGTEFSHFSSAFGNNGTKKRKVIGYYGAIAEWFNADLIEAAAKKFKDCDIVLIGNVTNTDISKLKYDNVHLLGEKAYGDLPSYLKEFDVCIIPFDDSTDLIKATNPVKFYEYLSAGKKIVSTYIPELVEYQNKYVYLAKNKDEFVDYIECCLQGNDILALPQEAMEFARNNDWSVRVQEFESFATSLFPKVSIIVLCYNQLDYTKKCIESILYNTAYPNYEIMIVDNASTDGTSVYLEEMNRKESRIKIKINEKNRGFAGGNNDGIELTDGEYIVLLNNDTIVTRGWLSSMVKHMRCRPNVGIVGAVTNSIGNEEQIEVEYNSITDMPAFAYGYTSRHMGQQYPHNGVLAMFCVMFSRALVSKIGLLDEHYGMGMFEDDDYSTAAIRAGYELIVPEDVFIHHFGSVSFKKLEDATYKQLFERNKAYFEQKWGTIWMMHHARAK